MLEYKTLTADALPSAKQLNELGASGWKLVQLLEFNPGSINRYIVYLIRTIGRDSMSIEEAQRVMSNPECYSETTVEVARSVLAESLPRKDEQKN